MRRIVLGLGCLVLMVNGRPQDEGFNPGQNSGMSGSGSGFNAGGRDETINFPDRGQNGYNPGNSGSQQGSNRPDGRTDGFNPGSNGRPDGIQGNNGFNPGYSSGSEGNRPDSDESRRPDSDSGNNGFNPGRNGNDGFNPGQNNHNGFNPGRNDGFNPGQNNGFHPGAGPGAAGFRTPIIFAEDEDVQENKSSLPPYQPGGDKRPYLRKPVEEDETPVIVLQGVPYIPIIQTANGNFVSASTLPSRIEYASAGSPLLRPYVSGQNKQPYLRGRQPVDPSFVPLFTADNPLEDGQVTAQTLPSPIVFAAASDSDLAPYVPGQNKQPYLRAPYVAGANKQQYLRGVVGRQTRPVPQIVPLIQTQSTQDAVSAQTLPSPIVFADATNLPPYQPGTNKQPYLRGRQPELKLPPGYYPVSAATYASDLPPYQPGGNKQPYLRSQPQQYVQDNEIFPAQAPKVNLPPGYRPAGVRAQAYNGLPDPAQETYQGPKNVLYFFK